MGTTKKGEGKKGNDNHLIKGVGHERETQGTDEGSREREMGQALEGKIKKISYLPTARRPVKSFIPIFIIPLFDYPIELEDKEKNRYHYSVKKGRGIEINVS